jgi:hypothetical protein
MGALHVAGSRSLALTWTSEKRTTTARARVSLTVHLPMTADLLRKKFFLS